MLPYLVFFALCVPKNKSDFGGETRVSLVVGRVAICIGGALTVGWATANIYRRPNPTGILDNDSKREAHCSKTLFTVPHYFPHRSPKVDDKNEQSPGRLRGAA